MGTMLSNGPIPSTSPSAPDTQLTPTPAGPVPTPYPAARLGPTVIGTNTKFFYIAFPFMTQMAIGTPTVTSPFPPVMGGAPLGPNQAIKGATKHFIMGQMLLRVFDPVRNNSLAGNSVAPVSTPSQCTASSLCP